MTEHDLRVCFGLVFKFIERERKMREHVSRAEPGKLRSKLSECDTALQAVTAIKDFAKLHVEESPEQVELFEVREPRGDIEHGRN